MTDQWLERLERFRPRKRFLFLPVFYTAEIVKRAWKMQLVFTLAGGLVFFADYCFYRAGRMPEFFWGRSLFHAMIPVFIIPAIAILILAVSVGVSVYRAFRHDKKP